MDETAKSRRRRWFHLTPERLLVALLPVWGVLFLCEHFHWLSKGYSVLLALASMGVAVLVLLLWFACSVVFRRRFQYSLRTLMLVMTLACLGMSWLGVEMQRTKRQREVVDTMTKLGGSVIYDYQIERNWRARLESRAAKTTVATKCVGKRHTKVTKTGVSRLQQQLPNCSILDF